MANSIPHCCHRSGVFYGDEEMEKVKKALDALDDQISQATKRLATMPGGEGAMFHICDEPPGRSRLFFEDGEIMFYKCVVATKEFYDFTPITELSYATKVEAASYIPDLIDVAVSRQGNFFDDVKDATSRIQDRLNKLLPMSSAEAAAGLQTAASMAKRL